jgi:hypothetical protein
MPRKLTRTDINFLLDAILLLFFVALCICSVILEYVFPAGTHADGWTLWKRSFNQWSDYRFRLLSAMALGVLIHVMLHWTWICGVASSRMRGKSSGGPAAHDDPSRTLWGVALLIVIINLAGAIIAVAALTVRAPAISS